MAKQTPDTPQPPAAEEQASRYHVTNHVDSTGHQTRNFSLFEDGAPLAVFATKRDALKIKERLEHNEQTIAELTGKLAHSGDMPAQDAPPPKPPSFTERAAPHRKPVQLAFFPRSGPTR